jgi:hypothetical protein
VSIDAKHKTGTEDEESCEDSKAQLTPKEMTDGIGEECTEEGYIDTFSTLQRNPEDKTTNLLPGSMTRCLLRED